MCTHVAPNPPQADLYAVRVDPNRDPHAHRLQVVLGTKVVTVVVGTADQLAQAAASLVADVLSGTTGILLG